MAGQHKNLLKVLNSTEKRRQQSEMPAIIGSNPASHGVEPQFRGSRFDCRPIRNLAPVRPRQRVKDNSTGVALHSAPGTTRRYGFSDAI
jgi:hypothetical protein